MPLNNLMSSSNKVRNAALLRDLRDFANQWDLNLMEQGFGKK